MMKRHAESQKKATPTSSSSSAKKKPTAAATSVGGMGTCLNLDMHSGASFVLDRLRYVNPASILTVKVEYNLSAQQVNDEEWMHIMEAIAALPFVNTISLSFRIPCPLPMRAFITLMEEAVALETLNLVGIQFKHNSDLDDESVVEELIQSFQESEELKTVQLCKYKPIVWSSYDDWSSSSSSCHPINDPLLLALAHLPNCKVFHVDHTDIFSDPQIRNFIFGGRGGGPFQTIKIGPQEKTINLARYLPLMRVHLQQNTKLKELIVLQMMSHESLIHLTRLLQTNTTLEKVSILRLETNDFGGSLGSALAVNTTLTSLELNIVARDRALFRQNVGLLASSLGGPSGQTTSLVTLKIDCMGIMIRNMNLITEPFLKILRHDNFVLQNLLINRNKGEPMSEELQFYLKLNQIGRNYFLRPQEATSGPPPLPPATAKATKKKTTASNEKQKDQQTKKKRVLDFREEFARMLIQNKQDVRILHYFISRNPSILSSTNS